MTDGDEALEQALRRVLWRLRPYLGELTLIGGWVPHLYRRYGEFASWRSRLSRTGEVDLIVGSQRTTTERPPLATLLADAGFESKDGSGGAIWANDPASGEKIEFFAPHVGTHRDIGRPRPVPGQAGIGAIALTDLELLQAHTRRLQVPVAIDGEQPATLDVRVPTLGAYLVTKAATFFKRTAGPVTAGGGSRTKDVLYVRDVMAAGPDVAARVELDVEEIRRTGASAVDYLRYASNQLSLLSGAHPILVAAAEELAVRDHMDVGRARHDLLGHVQDFRDILDG